MKWLLLASIGYVSAAVKPLIDVNVNAGDAVDILFLIQASAGLLDERPQIADSIVDAVEQLKDKDVKVGLASFVDKPNVGVGLGEFGGWPAGHEEDYCYRLHASIANSTAIEDLHEAVLMLPRASGLDLNEGHTEALTRLTHDGSIEWRQKASKVVVVFTNTLPHAGDFDPLNLYVDQFNSKLECQKNENGDVYTSGGFGSMVQDPSLAGMIMWTPWETEYTTYTNMLARQQCGVKPDLSEEEKETLALFEKAVLTPTSVDSVKPFDYSAQKLDPESHCKRHEYPTWRQTADILNQAGIKLVVTVVDLPPTRMLSNRVTKLPTGFTDWYKVRAPPSYSTIWNWILCSKADAMGYTDSDLLFLPWGDTTSFAPQLLKTLNRESHLDCKDINPEEPSTEEPACTPPELQVITLMDASGSWATRGGETSRKLAEALITIKDAYPEAHLGLASFVDKPAVGHGIGTFGGYKSTEAQADWCYKLIQALASDVASEDIQRLITQQQWGWGMDAPEAHLEAILNLLTDEKVGWSKSTETTKILLLITDDVAHAGDDYLPIAPDVEKFNAPVTCEGDTTKGGFGSITHGIRDLRSWTNNETAYYQLADLLKAKTCDKHEQTPEEVANMTKLYEQLEPTKVPSILPFNMQKLRSNPVAHCLENEYPTYDIVRDLLEESNVSIILMVLDFDEDSNTVVTPSRSLSTDDHAEQHRSLIPIDELPVKMQNIFARSATTRGSASRSAATIADVWNWVLTDPSALGGTRSFQTMVSPTKMDSFVTPVLSGLASLVPTCA